MPCVKRFFENCKKKGLNNHVETEMYTDRVMCFLHMKSLIPTAGIFKLQIINIGHLFIYTGVSNLSFFGYQIIRRAVLSGEL